MQLARSGNEWQQRSNRPGYARFSSNDTLREKISAFQNFHRSIAAKRLAIFRLAEDRICPAGLVEKVGILPDVFRPVAMPGGKPFQSKLTPFYEVIQRLRKKHTPYPEIAKRLHDEHGLKVSASTIFEFVKVRARRSGVFALPEVPTPAPSPAATHEAHGTAQARTKEPPAVDAGGSTPAVPPAGSEAPAKKYVFTPKPKRPSRFSDEDLEFNDPLK